MDKKSDKFWALCVCLVLALATIAVYWQLYHNEFIDFDDDLYIVDNENVKSGLTRQGLIWAFKTTHAYNWHPLTWLTHMLDCQFYDLNAGSHHLTNLLLHVANALLLFLVIKRMTGNIWPSAFVAAAFALHPLHVESVAWASERKDVLSTFFWILTTWAYLRYAERPAFARYLLIVLFFVLGLLAKQMLVTLPFVLLLLDYWPLSRFTLKTQSLSDSPPAADCVSIRRCILEKLPLFVLSAAAGVIVFLVQQGTVVMKSVIAYPLHYRIANAIAAYILYIGKMFWPAHLAVFYPHLGDSLLAWQLAGAVLLLVCITTAVIWQVHRRPYLAVGWFWYLGTLVPVIGFVQVGNQALADRYTYIPLTGLFIIIAWGIPDLLGRLHYRKVILSLSAAVLLSILGVATRSQVGHWRSDITVHKRATDVVPNNWLAHRELAHVLDRRGNLDEAVKHYSKSLHIHPKDSHTQNSLGLALVRQGKLDQAIMHFIKALQLRPDRFDVHINLGAAFAQRGRLDEAAACFTQALRIKPDAYKVHHNLGVLFVEQGKLEQAVTHFEQALRIKPDFTDAHINLGILSVRHGRFEEAIKHYTEALRIKPDSSDVRKKLADAHNSHGIALGRQSKLNQAITHFTSALAINPDFADAHNNLGYALFLQGKFSQASAHYARALHINPNLVDAHCNMAALLVRQRKTDEAIKEYRKALEINPNHTRARQALQALLKDSK